MRTYYKCALACALLLLAAGCQVQNHPDRVISGTTLHANFGVSTHQHDYGLPSSHTNWSNVIAKLHELGIRTVRDSVFDNGVAQWNTDQAADYQALTSAGVSLEAIVDPRSCPNGVGPCLNRLGGLNMKAVEWPNEYDNSGDPNWQATLTAWGHALYSAAHPLYKVIGPSLVSDSSRTTLGDQSAWLDFGNLHDYQGANPPDWTNIQNDMTSNAQVSGSKPFASTEFGWSTGYWASEQDQARFVLTQYFMHLRLNVSPDYQYELYDDSSSDTGIESRWGLVRADGSNKPAANAIKHLMTLVPDSAPTSLVTSPRWGFADGQDLTGVQYEDVQVAGEPSADYLLFWRDGSPTDTRTLTIGCASTNNACSTFQAADLVTDSAYHAVSGQTIQLGADPMVVHIAP